MLLTDNETRVDMLNNRAIADTVVKVIKENSNQPISIGVHGDWGAGKSSVLAMIEESFPDEKSSDIVCIRFNGWKHQGFEDSKLALMSAILSELTNRRTLSVKAKDTVKKLWKNINWISVAKAAGSVAFTATTGIPPLTLFTNLLDNLKSAVSDEEKVSSAVESVGNYLAESKVFEDVSLAKEFTEFQKSFKSLLQETNIKKLIVLIDDLDRCLPKVTIETLEAVRLFLFSESTAFVIAADEAMIEYAVRAYFPDFPGENDLAVGYQYSQRYLEKLIQVPFRIPVLGKVESEMYTTLLLIGSSINDGDPNFAKVLEVARTKMKTPWENHGFTIDEIQGAFGDDFSSIAEAFSVANQISDILSKNTQGNPRKIKRFINMLLLRKEIADARGFGAYIQLPIMAKMMLAEQFYPGEYKKIAKLLDEDGKCTQLSEFEETLEANATTQSRETADIPPIAIAVERKPVDTISSHSENPHISEWKSKPDFSSWVLSNPSLKNIDLRPYFFASKAAEDYFFDQTQSEQLRQLISKLMGGSMAVASAKQEIIELDARDARYVFDIISHKILQTGSLMDQPNGIEGLRTLVEHHPTLESSLVQLIHAMDCTKVGMWICTGWDKSIREVASKAKLEEYYKTLATNGPALVKAAAQKILNTKGNE